MYLSEQYIQVREELFIDMVEAVSEEFYDMSSDYQITEDDEYITSLLMDYFVEHYQQPTMRDAVMESFSGVGPNDALYEELMEMMLDETIGTFVAGAAHGIRNFLGSRAKKSTQRTANKARAKASILKTKTATAAKNAKGSTGISATFKNAKLNAIKKRSDAAELVHRTAQTNRDAAASKQKSNTAKTKDLANKIDTGITNVKNKVKSGIHRISDVAGRIAGKFA